MLQNINGVWSVTDVQDTHVILEILVHHKRAWAKKRAAAFLNLIYMLLPLSYFLFVYNIYNVCI